MSQPPMNPQTFGSTGASGGSLWDSLQIDVHAEFFPVPVPLTQLKQMSEGLIVEVGDLMSNKVRLHVEGKTMAIGELVVVGEKFGVRILEVQADGATGASSARTSYAQLPQPVAAATSGNSLPALASAAEEETEEEDDDFLNDEDFEDDFDLDEDDEETDTAEEDEEDF